MPLRVIITGATSGLGGEMAVQLAREGARVALSGRREQKLQEISAAVKAAGGEPLALVGSVEDPQIVHRHYAQVCQAWGGLDWAILNAGISEHTSIKNFKAEVYRNVFDINVMGTVNWIEAVLPDMLSAKSGTIAGVASLAGFRGLPRHGAYCASKAALITLLESLRVDLRGTGVSVVTICPGFVKSEMTARNDVSSMPFLMETKDGARAMLQGIKKKKRVVHFPWQLSYVARYGLPLIPDALYERFASRMRPLQKNES